MNLPVPCCVIITCINYILSVSLCICYSCKTLKRYLFLYYHVNNKPYFRLLLRMGSVEFHFIVLPIILRVWEFNAYIEMWTTFDWCSISESFIEKKKKPIHVVTLHAVNWLISYVQVSKKSNQFSIFLLSISNAYHPCDL